MVQSLGSRALPHASPPGTPPWESCSARALSRTCSPHGVFPVFYDRDRARSLSMKGVYQSRGDFGGPFSPAVTWLRYARPYQSMPPLRCSPEGNEELHLTANTARLVRTPNWAGSLPSGPTIHSCWHPRRSRTTVRPGPPTSRTRHMISSGAGGPFTMRSEAAPWQQRP